MPGQVGSADRGGPWEGERRAPEQDRAKSRMVARGSVPPFGDQLCASSLRALGKLPKSGTCGYPVSSPAAPAGHSARTRLRPPQVPGRRAQSRPGGTEITRHRLRLKPRTNFASAAASSRLSPTPGGRRASRGGACGELSYPAAPPAPLGAGAGRTLGPPRRVRALGEPLWDRSVGPRSPPSFQTCTARSILPLARTVSGPPYGNKH